MGTSNPLLAPAEPGEGKSAVMGRGALPQISGGKIAIATRLVTDTPHLEGALKEKNFLIDQIMPSVRALPAQESEPTP